MKLILNGNEKFHEVFLQLKSGDVLFCEDMTTLAQNFKELHERIEKILTLGACVYFKKENIQFSNQKTKEQEKLKYFLDIFYNFNQINLDKRRRLGIEKAKKLGKYNKERRKKIPFELRENLIKEREEGVPIQKIIEKYQISRKTFYNYTQYSTKNILNNIGNLLTEELMKPKRKKKLL